jgi:predicted 3-demethylubiquinone-9 3-methyltransferase (glyoxalase superfamily)
VVPVQLMQALGNPDPSKAQFAMSAMMKMKKIIIEDLYEK